MTTWQAFQAIAFHSLHLTRYVWLVSVALVLAAVAALVIGVPLRHAQFRRRFGVLLLTYLIPVVIIGIGAVFRYDGPRTEYVEPAAWRGAILWGVVLAHILAVAAAVILMRGWRIRVFVVSLPGLWLSLSTGFVSAIAIAGVGP